MVLFRWLVCLGVLSLFFFSCLSAEDRVELQKESLNSLEKERNQKISLPDYFLYVERQNTKINEEVINNSFKYPDLLYQEIISDKLKQELNTVDLRARYLQSAEWLFTLYRQDEKDFSYQLKNIEGRLVDLLDIYPLHHKKMQIQIDELIIVLDFLNDNQDKMYLRLKPLYDKRNAYYQLIQNQIQLINHLQKYYGFIDQTLKLKEDSKEENKQWTYVINKAWTSRDNNIINFPILSEEVLEFSQIIDFWESILFTEKEWDQIILGNIYMNGHQNNFLSSEYFQNNYRLVNEYQKKYILILSHIIQNLKNVKKIYSYNLKRNDEIDLDLIKQIETHFIQKIIKIIKNHIILE